MKLWVFALVALALVALGFAGRFQKRFKPGPLSWFVAWLAGIWVLIAHGFVVPIPASVQSIYLGIAALALLLFLSSDRERWQRVLGPLTAFMTERRYAPLLAAVVLLVPALVVANIWFAATAPPVAPAFGRTVHPAPPDSIAVHEETLSLGASDNPYRALETSDPEAFAAHLANGRRVYYENCFFCHGDLLRGAGMYSHGLNPIPTNFHPVVEQFQESFFFWRVAKGAPGLPPEGAPWDSAMPVWEQFLSTEEMWDVVLFLYDFTGKRPREVHAAEGGEH